MLDVRKLMAEGLRQEKIKARQHRIRYRLKTKLSSYDFNSLSETARQTILHAADHHGIEGKTIFVETSKCNYNGFIKGIEVDIYFLHPEDRMVFELSIDRERLVRLCKSYTWFSHGVENEFKMVE